MYGVAIQFATNAGRATIGKMWLWIGLAVGILIGLIIGVGIGFSLYKRAGTWD